jgi:hypothetical protein
MTQLPVLVLLRSMYAQWASIDSARDKKALCSMYCVNLIMIEIVLFDKNAIIIVMLQSG